MISEIYDRRSIRKFLSKPIPEKEIREILQSGIKAPSAKNRQPWKYIVVQGKSKEEMLSVFRHGIDCEEQGDGLLPGSRHYAAAARHTVEIMEEAPVTVFVVNPLGADLQSPLTPEERVYEICNVQSIGASIQNMLLAAQEKGIGSLWICDIYFAYEALRRWLNCEGTPAAAVAFGYPDEAPAERPRKSLEDVAEWRG